MQVLQAPLKIIDEPTKEALLEIVSDKYCRAIINTIMDKPMSAQEISTDCHIPISTVYRRVQTLHDAHMLYTTGQISQDGKKFFLYKSRVKEIQTSFKDRQVQVNLVFNQ